MFKADFHIHTKYSPDCSMSLEDIIQRCQNSGINCIAVADHGTTEGAFEMQKIAPFRVVVAEEILTPVGEIMGMFLKETIPSKITSEEAIARIKEQNGLVCIPHPFDPIRASSAMGRKTLESIVKQVDVVEVFNSRTTLPTTIKEVQAFAEKYGLPGTLGSDSHTPAEIGHAYMEMPEFQGREDFLQTLGQAKYFAKRTSFLVRAAALWAKLKK